MSEDIKTQTALSAARMDKDAPEPGARPRGKKRRKVSYLTLNKIETVDYKDTALLRRFINDRGKILPARQSGNTASQQRMIAECIRRAREMALLPFVVSEISADRAAGPRRPRRDDVAPAAEAPAAEATE